MYYGNKFVEQIIIIINSGELFSTCPLINEL